MRPTETTSRLVLALDQAKHLDLDKLFGSGIDVTLHDYTCPDREHLPRVTLAGEDFGPVREALIAALESALRRRVTTLRRELNDALKALGDDR